MRFNFPKVYPWVTRPLFPDSQDLPASDDAVRVWENMLVLTMRDNPLRTAHVWLPPDVLTVTYGTVRARMRFASPVGAHSCLWLQDVEPYAQPDHHEVDIAEHFGTNRIHHTVHWVNQVGGKMREHHATKVVADRWHVYGVNIKPSGYTFTVDGEAVAKTDIAAPARPKALILSLLSDDWERERYGLSDVRDYRTYIDWVEVLSR
jgi:beta-glucanase (GH16 family)